MPNDDTGHEVMVSRVQVKGMTVEFGGLFGDHFTPKAFLVDFLDQ